LGILLDRAALGLDQRLVHWPHPPTAEFRRRPQQGWQRLQALWLPLALLALWQAAVSLRGVDAAILASPLDALRATWSGLVDGSLSAGLLSSLQRAIGGLLIGGSLGLATGILLGLSRPAERALGPTLSALRQIAIFAWVPLLTAWFGLGEPAKLVFVSLATFFPLLI